MRESAPVTTTPALFHGLIRRFSASRPVSWVLARLLHHIDGPLARLTSARFSLTQLLTGMPVVVLTTHGARTGRTRSVPLLALPDGENAVLIASNWGQRHHPAWSRNLCAHPRARLTAAGRTRACRAREANEAERARHWARAVSLYPGYAEYKERTPNRQIRIFILEPDAEARPESDA